MREDCGFGKAKEMPRVGIGSVPDLVDNGNAFKTMDALRKQEKELRGKIDTMEVCAGGGGCRYCRRRRRRVSLSYVVLMLVLLLFLLAWLFSLFILLFFLLTFRFF